MLGYRLIRQSEIDLLQQRIDESTSLFTTYRGLVDADRAELQKEVRGLHERLASARESAASRASLVDGLTLRNNVLELEVAQLRQKLTGLPSVVPQINKASGRDTTNLGATAALFEDVGDDLAAELKANGQLGDFDDELPAAPAELLAPGRAMTATR